MRSLLPFALLALLVACAPATRPAPPPVAPTTPAPPPPAAPVAFDWRDRPVTPGLWTYTADARGSVAMFGAAGSDALAVLRCDTRLKRLFLSRAGIGAPALTVRTTSMTRELATGATGGAPPYHAALLPAADPLLDAMAFSRGRFALEEPGAVPLALPAWAEVGRVIEDCRG